MAFALFRLEGFTTLIGKSFISEMKEGSDIAKELQSMNKWFKGLPEDNPEKIDIGPDFYIFCAGVFAEKSQAEQESRRHQEKTAKIKALKETAINSGGEKENRQRIAFTAAFPDGSTRDFRSKSAFLEEMNVHVSFSNRLKFGEPLKSSKYKQIDGVILTKK